MLDQPDGETLTVCHYHDVTDERAMQLQLAQAEKLAAIGEMLSGVAHELNNPLTTIMGFSELLQNSALPEALQADLERIYRQAKRSAVVVQSLLTFARQSRIQVAEVDVNTLLEQTLEFMQPQFESHAIQVTADLAPQLPHILADAGQLQQVFLNLFNNALQAMSNAQRGGNLHVSSQAALTHIRLAVRDDGPGIRHELLRRVFDPFFTTKSVGEGTGLGLSICYGIVREHGGRIWAESELGRGATLFVELPIRHAAARGEALPAAPSTRPRRILIVEDDESIAALFRRVLEAGRHQLVTAADGEEGLIALAEAITRERPPELIIADLKMPKLDGRGFFERVQRDFPRLAARWLFVTGDTLRPESADFIQRCGHPCLSKPFGVHEIQLAVAAVLAD